jgi:hypothetical protein
MQVNKRQRQESWKSDLMKEIEDVNVKTPNGTKSCCQTAAIRNLFFPARYVKTLTGSRSFRISQKQQGRTKHQAHEDAKKRKIEAEGISKVAETLHWCGEKEAMACKSLVEDGQWCETCSLTLLSGYNQTSSEKGRWAGGERDERNKNPIKDRWLEPQGRQ